MNRARIIFCDPAWYGRTGTIVSRTACGGIWLRPDEWPTGEPDLVGRGEMFFGWNEFVMSESAVQVVAPMEKAA